MAVDLVPRSVPIDPQTDQPGARSNDYAVPVRKRAGVSRHHVLSEPNFVALKGFRDRASKLQRHRRVVGKSGQAERGNLNRPAHACLVSRSADSVESRLEAGRAVGMAGTDPGMAGGQHTQRSADWPPSNASRTMQWSPL